MRLPNADLATVDRKKLTDYLLSPIHPVGRSKAKFFHELGFGRSHIEEIRESLLSIARSREVVETIASAYGTKYLVDGTIRTPRGDEVDVRTIWIVGTGQIQPRFVTAYPR